MKMNSTPWQWAAIFCLAAWGGSVAAAEQTLDLTLPAQRFYAPGQSFILAANTEETAKAKDVSAAVAPAAEFDAPLFSGSNAHKYLGLGTVVLAGLTAMTASEGCEHNCPANQTRDLNSTHAKLAYATTAMAAATITSGLISHWGDFSTEDGWSDPDNLHVLLGVAGAALMAYAVQKSASQSTGQVSHAGIAELGALGMAVAIKLTW